MTVVRCFIREWPQQQLLLRMWRTCPDTFHQRSTRSLCSQTVDVLVNGDQQQSGFWEGRLHAPMTDNGRCFVTRDRRSLVAHVSMFSALLHRSLDCTGGWSAGVASIPGWLHWQIGAWCDDYSPPLSLFHLWKQVIGYNTLPQNLLRASRERRQSTKQTQTLNASAQHIAKQFSFRWPVTADGRDEEAQMETWE